MVHGQRLRLPLSRLPSVDALSGGTPMTMFCGVVHFSRTMYTTT
jgi:hypothetical protein